MYAPGPLTAVMRGSSAVCPDRAAENANSRNFDVDETQKRQLLGAMARKESAVEYVLTKIASFKTAIVESNSPRANEVRFNTKRRTPPRY